MYAVADKTIVSLYGECREQVSLSDEVLYGMPVKILDYFDAQGEKTSAEKATWCHIITHYRYEGYCHKEDLYLKDSCYLHEDKKNNLRVVIQAFADVLSKPKVQGVCLKTIPRGGRVLILDRETEHEGWLKVQLADGTIGYTKEKFLSTLYEKIPDNEEMFRKKLVETAEKYIGTQYRWGGKTPLGIDCSGLTSMCYMLCGVVIYRDAEIMDGFPVKKIDFEAKKPGDLLYFPGHIAMYIGDDHYIHSTGKNGSDGVVINSLNPDDADYREDLPQMLKYTGSIF